MCNCLGFASQGKLSLGKIPTEVIRHFPFSKSLDSRGETRMADTGRKGPPRFAEEENFKNFLAIGKKSRPNIL